jgi:cob(I)alamin adenosyltransferase
MYNTNNVQKAIKIIKRHKPLKLYTTTGDTGTSGLADGRRLPKSDPIFEVLGQIDELNSAIGFSVSIAEDETRHELMKIQHQLFDAGAMIAGSNQVELKIDNITNLEKQIDFYQLNTSPDWYKNFLLPGGTELAARLDLARTTCRRLERTINTHLDRLKIENCKLKIVLVYFNRLSDYLFALRCFVNSKAKYSEHHVHPK